MHRFSYEVLPVFHFKTGNQGDYLSDLFEFLHLPRTRLFTDSQIKDDLRDLSPVHSTDGLIENLLQTNGSNYANSLPQLVEGVADLHITGIGFGNNEDLVA